MIVMQDLMNDTSVGKIINPARSLELRRDLVGKSAHIKEKKNKRNVVVLVEDILLRTCGDRAHNHAEKCVNASKLTLRNRW